MSPTPLITGVGLILLTNLNIFHITIRLVT